MARALLKLNTLEHYDRVHREAHGTVLVWEARKAEKRWTKIQPTTPVKLIIPEFGDRTDVYYSVNEFHGWRLVRLLRSLRCFYVDVDGCTDIYLVLEALHDAGIPEPSFFVHSGRGLHLYWSIEPVSAQALPLWQRVQDRLIAALTPIGADPAARDCTRVLRLVGTKNGKSDTEVRGYILTDVVWDLNTLATEVVGYREPKPRATVVDFKATAARHSKRVVDRKATGSIYAWWHHVYADLCRVADYHWFGGVPHGYRDNMLFLMSNALSWFAHYDTLEREILRTAQTFMPVVSQADIKKTTQPIIKRAMDAQEGRTYEWQGKQYDPRYGYRAATMRALLGDLIAPPELWPELRALAPAEVIHERRRERDRAREATREARDRVAEGRYSDHNTGDGFRVGQEGNRASARLLRAQGRSIRSIANELGVSIRTIQRWCADP